MTRGFLLISHGNYAVELKESLKMIAGDVDHLEACGLQKTDSMESFEVKLAAEEEKLKDCDELYVFADMLGGSPCNTAFRRFSKRDDVHIIAGMNFPMILTALLTPDITAEEIMDAGRNGVVDVKAFSASADDEVDD
jgi:mannose/fructose-specific phosphotransferase system component IIA